MDTVHKTVLVTGAAGGVGRTICRVLAGQHFQVKGLVRPEDDVRGLEIRRENLIRGYVEDPQAVCTAMQGVDVVVHCAALLPSALTLGEEAFKRVNVEGALNVLRQVAKQKVSQAVFFSTIGVVDHITRKITQEELRAYIENPGDAYLSSKIDLEKALEKESKSFHGQIAVLRPAFIYGPGNFAVWHDALKLVRQGKMVLIGHGDIPLPLIYADDLARFVLLLINRPSEKSSFDIYVLASPESTTMKQVFYFIADYLGAKRPKKVSRGLLSFVSSVVAMLPEKLKFGRLRLLTKSRLLQYSKGYDLSGVTDPPPLGFVAPTGYQEGLAKMLDDYKRSLTLSEES